MSEQTTPANIEAHIQVLRDVRDNDGFPLAVRRLSATHVGYFEALTALDLDPVIAMRLCFDVTEAVDRWTDQIAPEPATTREARVFTADQIRIEHGGPEYLDLSGEDPDHA